MASGSYLEVLSQLVRLVSFHPIPEPASKYHKFLHLTSGQTYPHPHKERNNVHHMMPLELC